MTISVANAPCSYGAFEVTVGVDPNVPDGVALLDQRGRVRVGALDAELAGGGRGSLRGGSDHAGHRDPQQPQGPGMHLTGEASSNDRCPQLLQGSSIDRTLQ